VKVIPSAFAAHVATRNTTIATALKITRTDGEIYAFTTSDIDAVIDGVTYLSNPGLTATDIVITSGAQVGNLELTTLNDNSIFVMSDISNGLWRNAAFLIFRYNYMAVVPDWDEVDKLLGGTIGEAQIKQNDLVIELRDLRQYLQQSVGDASSKTCRARFGDARCGMRVNPPLWTAATAVTVRTAGDGRSGSVVRPTVANNRHFRCSTAGTTGGSEPSWNTTIGGTTSDGSAVWTTIQALTVFGTVTIVGSNQTFVDSSRTEAADFFGEGEFTFLTGDNAGAFRKIKSYLGGNFVMAIPYYGEVQVGDTYSAVAGCRKRVDEDCTDKFDNILNFVGEPHRMGLNNLTSAPTPDVSGLIDVL